MSGIINFVASDFLENTTGAGTVNYTRKASYSYSKNSFKKLWSRRYTPNRDTAMNSALALASTSPIQITVSGTTTTAAGVLKGQTLTFEGSGGSIGTVRSVYPDSTLALTGPLTTSQIILNSLGQNDYPTTQDIFFSSEEATIFIQFDTEGDLVDRDQIYLLVKASHVDAIVNDISKSMSTNNYTTISPNATSGIGKYITYIGVTPGESPVLD